MTPATTINPLILLKRATVVLALGGVFVLSGCAVEPGDKAAESGVTAQLPEEGEHSHEPVEGFDPSQKQTALPASFPNDLITLPVAAAIDDTGEYANGSWFVVLRTDSLAAGEQLLNSLKSENSFEQTAVETAKDGSFAGLLNNAQLKVEYVTLIDESGAALLSLVITRV